MGTGVSLGNFLNQQLRRPAEAESAFRNGITLDPDSSPLWNNLGDLLSEKPLQFAEAVSANRQAIRIEPDNAWPWCNLGNLLSGRLNQFSQAQAAYRRAISSDSKWAQPWNGLGTLIARRQLDRNDEAASAFLMSINLDTTQKAAWSNLTYLWSQEPGLVRNQTTENIHKLLSLAATRARATRCHHANRRTPLASRQSPRMLCRCAANRPFRKTAPTQPPFGRSPANGRRKQAATFGDIGCRSSGSKLSGVKALCPGICAARRAGTAERGGEFYDAGAD